jgi:hypothetical protein
MTRSTITLRASANLMHPGFCSRHLGKKLTEFAWEVLHDGTEIQRFVLEWCLDNLVPYRTWQDDPESWSFITYEELFLQPGRVLEVLGDELGLDVTRRMMKLTRVPSASTSIDRRKPLTASPSSDWLVQWRSNVSGGDERDAFGIVNRFGIDLYGPGNPVAFERYLRFRDTMHL